MALLLAVALPVLRPPVAQAGISPERWRWTTVHGHRIYFAEQGDGRTLVLLHGGGELGELLGEVMAYERGDFDAAAALIRRHPDIEQIYREATRWADLGIAELL